MRDALLFQTDQWVILLAVLAGLMAASEAGFRLGCRSQAAISDKTKSQIGTVEAAILGILGLLLAFTMSMAVSRFEVRKQAVLDEANAIGTAYLRTRLLPAPEGPEIADLLRRYLDVRVDYVHAAFVPGQLTLKRAEAARLQSQIWSRTVAYAQKDPNPAKVGLLLQSLNQVIDAEASSWTGFHNHVPETVIYVNPLVALLAVLLVGYVFGLEGRRQVFSFCLLALAIGLVLTVIIDLDRSYRGLIQVGQQPLIELQQQLRRP
jgi:hypothetical protein